jgi:SAM-dependent methyltransferase
VYLDGEPSVLRCGGCALVFLAELPARDTREGFYQEEYYSGEAGGRFLGIFERAIRAFRAGRVRDIVRHLSPAAPEHAAAERKPDAFLDVGCGRGLLLDLFRERGWEVCGTQLSRTAARACEERLGGAVLCGELPELGLEALSFRAVALYHVLEHLDRPLDYLREVNRLLRDDGLLVIEVPDASSIAFRVLGRRDLTFDHPHHLFFFTPPALDAMLERADFDVVSRSRFSLEYSPFTTLQNLLNLLPGEPNRLYRALMRNRDGARLRRHAATWMHAALAALLAAPALAISLASLVLPLGNTLRVYCRKSHRSRESHSAATRTVSGRRALAKAFPSHQGAS